MGNSGGPLIDARGLVIGITAAVSRQASNIGFAIPINQARDIVPQLLAQGRVSRGFMGITLRDVDPDLRQALALPDRQGALIQDVTAGSPGARAGLQPYDLVTAVDEGGVASNESLIRTIALRRPGTTARLTVYRDGRLLEVPVKLAERPAREERPAVAPRGRAGDASPSPVDVGLSLIEITEENAHRFDVPAGVVGLLVQRVEPLSEAFEAGIRRGQVLLELNRRPVQRVAAFRERLEEARRVGVVAVLTLDPEEGQRMIRTLRVDGR
jgi:serine protease Do